MDRQVVIDMLRKYTSVVIWGLNEETTSCQRHVHRHMYSTLCKLGYDCLWCDNTPQNNDLVKNGSLVISSVECCQNIQYRKSNWYALFHTVEHIENCQNYVLLRVYGDSDIGPDVVDYGKTATFNKNRHLLSQSYGTDLLPEEFHSPIFNRTSIVNWIGSIWDDKKGHGNIDNIEIFRKALERHHLSFKRYRNISDAENAIRVRESRIAPAIGGKAQTASMIPCRLWKNISYGQLGVTNLRKGVDVFGDSLIYHANINSLIDMALLTGETEYKDRTRDQQEIVKKGHTYLNWFHHLLRAFEEMGVQ